VSDLRLIGRSDDGSELELQDAEGRVYSLRIGDQLRALVNQPRLVSVEDYDQQPAVSVKEIQSRLRAGESVNDIARNTDWNIEKIERFAGPILQERAYIIGLALEAQLRKEKHSPTLATATIAQLAPRGVDMTAVEWNTRRNIDGTWNILLMYPLTDGGSGQANWTFDSSNRTLISEDEGAEWISGEERTSRPSLPTHGMVYPSDTPAPRLVAVREEQTETIQIFSTPDPLAPTESELAEEAERDGITKRLKIPSWDDIMFGKKEEE